MSRRWMVRVVAIGVLTLATGVIWGTRVGAQALDIELVIDVNAFADSPRATVTVDGESVSPPVMPADGVAIYCNEKLLGRDVVSITDELLREFGVPLSARLPVDEEDVVALLVGQFEMVDQASDLELIECSVVEVPLASDIESRVMLIPVTVRRPENQLDSVWLLAMHERGSERGLGALVRFRGSSGAMVTGHSARGFGDSSQPSRRSAVVALQMRVRPSLTMYELPLAEGEEFGLNREPAAAWWIEQFPSGTDLVR